MRACVFVVIMQCCVFQDLKYIYGRYIDPSSEEEKNMYVKFQWRLPLHSMHVTSLQPLPLLLPPLPLQLFLTLAICHFPLRVFSNSCWLRSAALLISTNPDHEGLPLLFFLPHALLVHQQHFKCTLHLSHQARRTWRRTPVLLIKWAVHGGVLSSWFLSKARQTICFSIANN